jgi:predicted ATPase/class 3 adenylate cyclase/DNA-binding CsgD family transcriptional regulator
MTALPTGTVTFLFTDMEGSTRLLEAWPEVYRAALARHDAIVEQAIAAHDGTVFQRTGDSFAAAFANPSAAMHTALAVQRALQHEHWGELDAIRVRIGLHTGEVEIQGGQYFGIALHRCARLMSCAHGGQTVLSAVTASLVRETLPPETSLKDLGVHHLRDLTHPEHLFQLVGAELPADFPPPRTLTVVPNKLPYQATEFIGREQQLQAVRTTLLRSDTRLLTLTGPGGTGKTRLAIQVAANLLDGFADGVVFVPLASVTNPELVPSTIAQALDLREAAGASVVALLQDALRQKQLLLVLDNFEQVVVAAPIVAELLAAAPGLRILVTSRAPLGLYGEREHSVPPLALPDRRATPSAAHLAHFEAVRLFVDRAQSARPDFAVTDENAADVAEICHLLDGLPLAIELAAARLRSLPPGALLQRMERRLPLLTGGARDLPARQQTLRNTIAWSYDLLSSDEQALFRRLAVFQGCTLEAAEMVCAGEASRPGATSVALSPLEIDVLDGLESLVAKSLLRQAAADGQPWYVMLETVREYGLERLKAGEEAAALRRRHAEYYLGLAEEAEPKTRSSPEQREWLARLGAEHDNLRAALEWSQADAGAGEIGLRLAGALLWFWLEHNHITEGRTWLERARAADADTSATVKAKALYALGSFARRQGDYQQAATFCEEALMLSRTAGDRWGLARGFGELGMVARQQGDHERAGSLFAQAMPLFRELGDRWGMAWIGGNLGHIAAWQGNYEQATALYQGSLATFRAQGDQLGIAWSLGNLGNAAMARDDVETAEPLYEERLALYLRLDVPDDVAYALGPLAELARRRGDYGRSRAVYEQILTQARLVGDRRRIAGCLEGLALLAATQAGLQRAAVLFGAAGAATDAIGAKSVPIQPSLRPVYDREMTAVRRALGEEVFAAACAVGRAMSLDEAVTAALAITEEAVSADTTVTALAKANGAAAVLTQREQEVAALIVRGYTNRKIADELVITEGTAANHVNHILNKLGFGSRAQIAVWAADHGLLDEGLGA